MAVESMVPDVTSPNASCHHGAMSTGIMPVTYIRETSKPLEQAVSDLQKSAADHGFGVLHQYDFRHILEQKGFPIGESCIVMEICQPKLASDALSGNMRTNLALPCRMSVFTEHGRTHVGMIPPTSILSLVGNERDLEEMANAVEQTMRQIIDEAV